MSENLPTGTCPRENGNGDGERILVVDDEEMIVEMMKEFLEKLGYKIDVFSNPLEALEIFKKNPNIFDLVITDLMMPKMNGEKLAVKIRETRAEVPIIFATGTPWEMESTDEIVLEKPFLMKVLRDMVREVLDAAADEK